LLTLRILYYHSKLRLEFMDSKPIHIVLVLPDGTDLNGIADDMRSAFEGDETARITSTSEDGVFRFEAWVRRQNRRVNVRVKAHGRDSTRSVTPSLPSMEVVVSGPDLDAGTIDPDVLLGLIEEIYEAASPAPLYVYVLDHGQAAVTEAGERRPVTEETILDDRINDVSWAMLFPPRLVDVYGEAFLRDAPAWRTDTLDDGGVMLVAGPAPTDIDAVDSQLRTLRGYFELRG
jgi:hypothetical protein